VPCAQAAGQRLPVAFVPNVGQWNDEIRARLSGATASLHDDGLTLGNRDPTSLRGMPGGG